MESEIAVSGFGVEAKRKQRSGTWLCAVNHPFGGEAPR